MNVIIDYLSSTKEVSGIQMIGFGVTVLLLHDWLSPLGAKLYYIVKHRFVKN